MAILEEEIQGLSFVEWQFPNCVWSMPIEILPPANVHGYVHYPSKTMVVDEDSATIIHELIHVFWEEFFPWLPQPPEEEIEQLALNLTWFIDNNFNVIMEFFKSMKD
jgi:hypothetical protein